MPSRGIACAIVLGIGCWAGSNQASAALVYPSGSEGFEALNVGESVSLLGWIIVNTSNPEKKFTVVATDDGSPPPGSSSTRWLRILDTDAANVQNRFYSPEILNAAQNENYTWTFHVKLEQPPAAGPSFTRFTIQHFSGAFNNAWGIEFRPTGVFLIVTGIGGIPASIQLYSFSPGTAVGDWVKIELGVDFTIGTVWASANDGPSVSLPTNLNGDRKFYRFCYRGEGTGNTAQMLLDEVSVEVTPLTPIPTVGTWGLVLLTLLILTVAKIRLRERRPGIA